MNEDEQMKVTRQILGQQRKGIILNQHRPAEQSKLHRERPL